MVRSARELHVALFAFLLNLPWEFLQVPLYAGMPVMPHWEAVQTCIQAALGDVLITLMAYWSVVVWHRRHDWLRGYGAKECVGWKGEEISVRSKVMRPKVPYFVAIPAADGPEPDWCIVHDFCLPFHRGVCALTRSSIGLHRL